MPSQEVCTERPNFGDLSQASEKSITNHPLKDYFPLQCLIFHAGRGRVVGSVFIKAHMGPMLVSH